MVVTVNKDYPEKRRCDRCKRELKDHGLMVDNDSDDDPDGVLYFICPTRDGETVKESMGEMII